MEGNGLFLAVIIIDLTLSFLFGVAILHYAEGGRPGTWLWIQERRVSSWAWAHPKATAGIVLILASVGAGALAAALPGDPTTRSLLVAFTGNWPSPDPSQTLLDVTVAEIVAMTLAVPILLGLIINGLIERAERKLTMRMGLARFLAGRDEAFLGLLSLALSRRLEGYHVPREVLNDALVMSMAEAEDLLRAANEDTPLAEDRLIIETPTATAY